MNIPNSLSLARICLIPLFVTAYFLPYEWGVYAAIAIFIICCFTDFLDGFIGARIWASCPTRLQTKYLFAQRYFALWRLIRCNISTIRCLTFRRDLLEPSGRYC